MEQFFEILSQCPLFDGIDPADMTGMFGCLNAKVMDISKGSPVFLEGDPVQYVGVVLSGTIQIVRDDYCGNRSVLTVVAPAGLFAEAFSCAGLESMPVSAIALQPCTVLLLDCRRMLQGCSHTCPFHSRLLSNLLHGLARKNLSLTQKIRYMSQKTTRDKLMEFLLDQAKLHGSPEFVIPFDRQGLADYLGVERSAMSAEIGKLKKAGLIDSKGSRFRVRIPGGESL